MGLVPWDRLDQSAPASQSRQSGCASGHSYCSCCQNRFQVYIYLSRVAVNKFGFPRSRRYPAALIKRATMRQFLSFGSVSGGRAQPYYRHTYHGIRTACRCHASAAADADAVQTEHGNDKRDRQTGKGDPWQCQTAWPNEPTILPPPAACPKVQVRFFNYRRRSAGRLRA